MAPTEWVEVAFALYDALPDDVKSRREYRGGGAWRRMKAIYDHWDKIDVETAVENVIWNMIEDAAIGRAQRQIDKFALKEGVSPEWWYTNKGRANVSFEMFDAWMGAS
jgi:hypothetical protein